MTQAVPMVTKVHGLIAELDGRSTAIKGMALASKIGDADLDGAIIDFANTSVDLDRVARCVETLISTGTSTAAEVEVGLGQLLSAKTFYGQFCEFGVYDWLLRKQARFATQQKLTGNDVLNPNGCTIDGQFTMLDACFDIKGMGFQVYVADQFKRRLEQMCPGLQVTIDGAMDIAVKDIELFAFGSLAKIATALSNGGIYKIPELGWTIRAGKPQRVASSVTFQDPYRLAQENRFYPFKTAGQFTRDKPFILVFAYTALFNHGLFTNFIGSTATTLRSLSRRAFIELSKDSSMANKYDGQVAKGTTVQDASSLLSALVFLNLDNEDEAWIFLNPRAKHKLTKGSVEQLFDFQVPAEVDDFEFDNY